MDQLIYEFTTFSASGTVNFSNLSSASRVRPPSSVTNCNIAYSLHVSFILFYLKEMDSPTVLVFYFNQYLITGFTNSPYVVMDCQLSRGVTAAMMVAGRVLFLKSINCYLLIAHFNSIHD